MESALVAHANPHRERGKYTQPLAGSIWLLYYQAMSALVKFMTFFLVVLMKIIWSFARKHSRCLLIKNTILNSCFGILLFNSLLKKCTFYQCTLAKIWSLYPVWMNTDINNLKEIKCFGKSVLAKDITVFFTYISFCKV